jgi:hypothetical protein
MLNRGGCDLQGVVASSGACKGVITQAAVPGGMPAFRQSTAAAL